MKMEKAKQNSECAEPIESSTHWRLRSVMDFSSSIKSHFFRNHDSHYDFFVVFTVCWIILLARSLRDSCRSHTWVGRAMKLVPFTNLMYAVQIGGGKTKVLRDGESQSCIITFVIQACTSYQRFQLRLQLGWLQLLQLDENSFNCETFVISQPEKTSPQ